MNQTAVSRLMRIAWRTVGKILERVVADKLDHDRLDGLVYIGVDEVSHGSDRQFLTCVADHLKPRIVWAAPGRNAQTLQGFFAQLTDEQKRSIKAVSIDMSAGYEKAIRAPDGLPHAQVCFDPFHVVKLGGEATDKVPPRRVQPPRPLLQRHRQVDQGSALLAAQGHRQPDPQAAAQARRGRDQQQGDVPRVPALRRAALHLSATQAGSRRAPRGVARLGIPVPAQTVRQARPHDPPAQTRRSS
jgi:transposase